MSTDGGFLDDNPDEFVSISTAGQVSKRQLVVLAIDTSYSMRAPVAPQAETDSPDYGRRRIDELNDALQEWIPRVRTAPELRSAEFAIVTYGRGGVTTIMRDPDEQPEADGGAFMPAASIEIARFEADGTTPMVEAIRHALDLARRRSAYLRSRHRLQSTRPRIITITDGLPSDDEGNYTEAWRALGAQLRRQRESKQSIFVAFGVAGASEEVLSGLAGDDAFIKLATVDFVDLLDLVFVASSAADPYEAIQRAKENR